MKVKDLEIGMLLEPAGDCEAFQFVNFNKHELPYITIRVKNTHVHMKTTPRQAMYLGRRKDINVEKNEMAWSDRFVMIGSTIAAVDPSSWGRMKPMFGAK